MGGTKYTSVEINVQFSFIFSPLSVDIVVGSMLGKLKYCAKDV